MILSLIFLFCNIFFLFLQRTKLLSKENGEQGIAFHAGCAVFKFDIKIDNLTAPYDKSVPKGNR